MLSAPPEPASVYVGGGESAVKPETRKSLAVDVPAEIDRLVRDRLDARRKDLARHFQLTLERCDAPQYLVYEPGGFFRPHKDTRPSADTQPLEDAGRLVSAVIFLSTPDAAKAADYAGGELRLFDLVDDPKWRGIGLAGDAAPGLLLAFRSDTIHEVTEVTRGVRCAIAAWFR
jgi:SM-20-related protein